MAKPFDGQNGNKEMSLGFSIAREKVVDAQHLPAPFHRIPGQLMNQPADISETCAVGVLL
jgi:hypothetical protein